MAAVQQVSRPDNRRNRRTRRCPAHSHLNGEHLCAYWSGLLNPIADVQRPTQPSEPDLQAQVRDKFLGKVWQVEGMGSGKSVAASALRAGSGLMMLQWRKPVGAGLARDKAGRDLK
ncbi:hypothetical protein AUC61_08575 [Pseudomonas sp. S25]|uniref:Uncharacterized protein n=1 Tax=Pseudomonas maioricensis TaxID=1766623 RepID=A0ABS9ZG67_9PSED|nr:hypothetical protein [Pseudomonas sp. S25]